MKSFVFVTTPSEVGAARERKVTLTEAHIRALEEALKRGDWLIKLPADDELVPYPIRLADMPDDVVPLGQRMLGLPPDSARSIYFYACAVFCILEEQGMEHAGEEFLEIWKDEINNRAEDLY